MRILIDGRLYGLENAGLGRYVMNLVIELSKLDSSNEYLILLRKKYFENLQLPNNWKKISADFHHYSFTEQIRLPLILAKERPDIVHFPHFNAPLLYLGKYIVTIHDMLMHKSVGVEATTLPGILYLIKRIGYRLTFTNAVRQSSRIIVPSYAVSRELISYYKIPENKVVVTYEGINFGHPDSQIKNVKNRYFIYTGNAYPHKNLKKLIEVLVILNKNSIHKTNLLIASSRGIFTQRLERIIQDQNAHEFVQLVGFVSDSELFDLYRNSVGLVFPSLSEGFGLPGLEAMAAGTLVLVSDIQVFREIYKDNALYFDPKSSASIAAEMEKALNMSANLRSEKIRKAKNFAKQYSWAKMAKETLKVYKQSLASQGPGKQSLAKCD